MARWKLLNAHYINSPDSEWEYKENDRKTGRQRRYQIPVPRLVDPRDPSDWTNRWGQKDNEDGECIVCYAGKGEASDIVFTGDPTPDMMPVDDEASAISATFTKRWEYKPDVATEGSFSQSLIDKFQSQMPVESAPAKVEGLSELIAAITAMTKSNQDLVEATVKRRV